MTRSDALPDTGPALAWANRRVLAERLGWPAGVLEECERVEPQHPRWSITWSAGNDIRGFERPAGFYGVDREYKGWHPVPAYGATVAELVDAITATGTVTAAEDHQPERPSWDCNACGAPWPCDPAREDLVSTMDTVQVGVYAAVQLGEAVRDLPATPPGELFDRFLAWTRSGR